MPNRTIKSGAHGSHQALNDTISSLFALELMMPSQQIYLISPWVTDFVLLDNSLGQFRALLPEHAGRVRLSSVLNLLAERDASINVLTLPNEGLDFISRLHSDISHRTMQNLHEKSLLTDRFYLRGSLNFTFSGFNRNVEHAELSTDAADLARARVEAREIWEGAQAC